MGVNLYVIQTVILYFLTGALGQSDKVLFCYVQGWSVWRAGDGKFDMSNIDPNLCTHIVYSFIGVDEENSVVKSRDRTADYLEPSVLNQENNEYMTEPQAVGFNNIEKLVGLKSKNPNLKILVSLGGWSEGSINYSKVCRTPSKRASLIKSISSYLREHKFDGFDFSWEYPADRGGLPQDKQNLVTLFKELREEVKNKTLLTLRISGLKYNIVSGYDLKELSEHLDYIHLISFWYYSAEDKLTGWNAPLDNNFNEMNVKFTTDYVLSKGVPKNKILMGFATFGQTFIMNKKENNDIYFRVLANESFKGKWTDQYGFIGYNEICSDLRSAGSTWKEKWHDDTCTPYVVKGNQLISYDNGLSFKMKLDFLASRDLAGASVYSLDVDDFLGLCGDKYPLINLIKKYFTNVPIIEPTPLALETQVIKFGPQNKVFYCYFSSWSVWRGGAGQFHAGFIDPFLCTHIVYSFIGLDKESYKVKSRDPNSDNWDEAFYAEGFGNLPYLVNLKKENPDLKILISLGGYADGSRSYSQMVSDPKKRSTFIESVINYIRENKLDGLDIDWEYPGKRGGSPTDKTNFVLLLKELKQRIKSDYLLSVQLHVRGDIPNVGYDLKSISDQVDFINLATYFYQGPWNKKTGTISPLNGTSNDVEFSVKTAIGGGVSPEKLLLGFLTSGHPYLMDQEPQDDNYLDVPASNVFKGQWTNEPGYIGFYEICWNLDREDGWQERWNPTTHTPYAINGKKYISYDNVKSYQEKLSLITKYNLGGAMLYTLDGDDFRGKCYGVTFPLALTIKNYLVEKQSHWTNVVNSTVVHFSFPND